MPPGGSIGLPALISVVLPSLSCVIVIVSCGHLSVVSSLWSWFLVILQVPVILVPAVIPNHFNFHKLPCSLTPADLVGCAHLSVGVVPVLSPHLWSLFSAQLYDDSPV